MDEKQKADYINSPTHCPYSNSDKISGKDFSFESFTQTIECLDCGKEWTDIYTLTDVEPAEQKSP